MQIKHGDLILYDRKPMVVVDVEGVFVLVFILTFLDNFDIPVVTVVDFRLALKREYCDFSILVVDRDDGIDELFDSFDQITDGYAWLSGNDKNCTHLGKNIAA